MNLLLTLLTTLFIGLKLTGYIDWSWWLVLSPILAPLALAALLGLLAGAIWLSMSKEERELHALQSALKDYAKALKQ